MWWAVLFLLYQPIILQDNTQVPVNFAFTVFKQKAWDSSTVSNVDAEHKINISEPIMIINFNEAEFHTDQIRSISYSMTKKNLFYFSLLSNADISSLKARRVVLHLEQAL